MLNGTPEYASAHRNDLQNSAADKVPPAAIARFRAQRRERRIERIRAIVSLLPFIRSIDDSVDIIETPRPAV